MESIHEIYHKNLHIAIFGNKYKKDIYIQNAFFSQAFIKNTFVVNFKMLIIPYWLNNRFRHFGFNNFPKFK